MATENDFITPAGLYVYETANVVGNTTSSDMYASITESLSQPSVMFDFYKSKRLDSRLEFTRATTGSYYDADGILSYAKVNEPRFDYDPVTGISKGLLIEEARTNLLTYSEQLDNAAWTKTRSSVIAIATTAPDGTITAIKLIEDSTASETHQLSQGKTKAASAIRYATSIYIKSDERSRATVGLADFAGNESFAIFNLSTKTVSTPVNNGTFTGGTATITEIGNGWFQCSIAATSSISTTIGLFVRIVDSSDAFVYTGDGASGIYIWGAQLEAGACATSYIPTIASAVTRTQDIAIIKDANFRKWYTTKCIVYVEVSGTNTSAPPYPVIFHLDNDDTTSFIGLIYYGGTPNLGNISVRTSNGVIYNETAIDTGTVVNDTFCKIAVLINNEPGNINNYIIGCVNGVSVTFTNSSLPTDITRLRIGSYRYDQQLNGHIKKLAFYQRTDTNATTESLKAMTL